MTFNIEVIVEDYNNYVLGDNIVVAGNSNFSDGKYEHEYE